MKTGIRILTAGFLMIMVLSVMGQDSKVQFKVAYNPSTGLYEAYAHVIGASLAFPNTIPFPSKFTVVVPSDISDSPFTVVQSVNPPGLSWSQSNSIYAPEAAPENDFHAFTISGGGGGNAYQGFLPGKDILLFTFSLPQTRYEEGIRCYVNGSDPNSAQPGMAGIDFRQAFKTAQPGLLAGADRYQSNISDPEKSPNLAERSTAN